ncbi:MAG: SWIM zinc finger domain-containing protein [Actinomycetota bacterium]|nr:SWIM zinc finger domain-containing protein [Actinomycetota bacterium]
MASIRTGALSILREGRLTLLNVDTDSDREYRPLRIVGRVEGHHGIYAVDYWLKTRAWMCTCKPHMDGSRDPCAHILAVQLVTGGPQQVAS